MENPYKILKVDASAPLEVIKAAYRALMKYSNIHPDRGGSKEEAQIINEAYQLLITPEKKKDIDDKLENNSFSRQRKPSTTKEVVYIIICTYCRDFNKVLSIQHLSQAQCYNCNQPFFTHKKTPPLQEKERSIKEEQIAYELFSRNLYSRALQEFRDLVKKSPLNSDYEHMAGMCLFCLSNHHDALFHFERAVRKNNENWKALLFLGKSLMYLGRLWEAQRYLQQCFLFDKKNILVQANLAICYYKQRQYAESTKNFHAVVKEDPTLEKSVYLLAMSYYNMYQHKQARTYFSIALKYYPQDKKILEMMQHCDRHLRNL